MGLQIFETTRRKRMVRHSKAFLRSHGWRVSDATEDVRLDFVAQKNKMLINFSCTDDDNRKYINGENFIKKMQEFTIQIRRNRNQLIVWILESELRGHSNTSMAEIGLIVLLPNELPVVADIHRFEKELPTNVSAQEAMLLSSSFYDCVRIANAFELAGDNHAAIEWLSRAIKAYRGFSSAYWKLFCLLQKTEEFDRAEAVAVSALQLRGNDSAFLRGMEKLELERGRADKAAIWKAKILKAELDERGEKAPAPITFEQMMERRGFRAQATSSTAMSKNSPKNSRSWIKRVFTSKN
jgi:tetratricopeptide (TPR) repeat protein